MTYVNNPMSREDRLLNELERQRQTTRSVLIELERAKRRIFEMEEIITLAIEKPPEKGKKKNRKCEKISKKNKGEKR